MSSSAGPLDAPSVWARPTAPRHFAAPFVREFDRHFGLGDELFLSRVLAVVVCVDPVVPVATTVGQRPHILDRTGRRDSADVPIGS